MCVTACWTDFAPGRPSCSNSAACVGRSAIPNATATKKPLRPTSTSARTMRAAVVTARLYPARGILVLGSGRRPRRGAGQAIGAEGHEQQLMHGGGRRGNRDRERVVRDVPEADR